MLNVKLVVLSVLIIIPYSIADYCEICLNHTLCQYPITGPSTDCIEYDDTALLTKGDISHVLNKINERRNFIALGLSRRLPQAANMRKIRWSEELALSAQRWVDQCDPTTNPDRLDSCRDLANIAVGQNVATILGPAPGLTVKSFIDTWFMQKMDYTGSVSFYNQSKDAKTNYFTQVIWAETDTIGCGKSRFYIEGKNTIAERLVCNFAPKGNLQGKPVYAIGFAATQCPEGYVPDEAMRGLCTLHNLPILKFTPKMTSSSSLLRVLNLSNNSMKNDIDPIKNNLKLTVSQTNNSEDHRNQKIRHVLMNNTHVAVPLFPQRRIPWDGDMNTPKNPSKYQQERGHSRVYHGDDHKDNFIPQIGRSGMPNFRRYDYTTESYVAMLPSSNFRRQGVPIDPFHPCSRRSNCNNCPPPGCNSGCVANRCTRGLRTDCCGNQPCQHGMCPQNPCPFLPPPPPPPWPPILQPLCPPAAKPCCETACCNSNPTSCCPKVARRNENNENKDETRKQGDLHYYDLLPNLAVRSGDKENEKPSSRDNLLKKRKLRVNQKSTTYNTMIENTFKVYNTKDYQEVNDQVKSVFDYPKYNNDGEDYLYGSFGYSDRVRRQPEEQITFKPFWQLEEYDNLRPSSLKAVRYTTLKRNRKTWPLSFQTQTEPITIILENSDIDFDGDNEEDEEEEDEVTEKFFSFDELMHLRKSDTSNYETRRKGGKGTTKGKKKDKKKDKKTTSKKATKAKSKTKAPKTAKTKKTKAPKTTKAKTTKTKHAKTKKATTAKKTTKKATTKPTKKAAITTAHVEKLKEHEETPETEHTVTAPANYTTNTPFKRKKHCTRQLTCTWTAATITASDGSIINPNGGGIDGSRTPPGYVEGCTRTSTCTRDFQNRNKYSIVGDDKDGDGGGGGGGGGGGEGGGGGGGDGAGGEDGDYCERRDLDLQLRDIESKPIQNLNKLESPTAVSSPPDLDIVTAPLCNDDSSGSGSTNQCACSEDTIRSKRHLPNNCNNQNKKCNRENHVVNQPEHLLSYGELYYLVLTKIMNTWKDSEKSLHAENCECISSTGNGSKSTQACFLGFFLSLTMNFM